MTDSTHHFASQSILDLTERVAGIGSWRVDLNANTLRWSQHVYHIHGLSPETYTPELASAIDFYHPDDREHVRNHINKAIQEKSFFSFELRLIHADGTVRWVDSRGECELDEQGAVCAINGIFQDITERKNIQERVRISEERYELAVQGSSVGLWDWDTRTNTLYWSPRFKEIIGLTDASFTPEFREFESRLHPDDHARIMEAQERHLVHREPYDVEYRLRRTDDQYVWIHARGQAIWDAQGNPLRMAGSVDDITEKKRLDNSLNESQAFLRLILDRNPSLVFVKDRAFRIVEANEAFFSVYPESTRDAIIGTTTVEHYDPEEAEAFLKHDRIAFEEGLCDYTEIILFPDGKNRHLHTVKLRFHNSAGEPFILCIAHDVTEREFMIRQLKATNEDLDRFAFVASHDLKAPLQAIKNLSAWIFEDAHDMLPDASKRHVTQLQQRVVRMENLLEDLLQYSRAGRKEYRVVQVDIAALIQEIIELIEPPSGFDIQVASDLPTLTSAYAPLQQIFLNLIGNAVKHHHNDQGHISISWRPNGRFASFKIKDDGPGIPEAYHERVFELFQTLKPRDKVEGSGMGLAIVKKLLDHHGGAIHMQSQEDKGTTFIFDWPFEYSNRVLPGFSM